MNEYYKYRYNISKFFTNTDNDDYYNYLMIIIPVLYIIPVLLLILLFILGYKKLNVTIIIIIFLFVLFIILTYRLIRSLKSIQNDEIISNYMKFYKVANMIYKENYFNSNFVNVQLKDQLLLAINNIENLYGEQALAHLNSSYDILQYSSDINNDYINKLYIDNFKKFKFLNSSMQFIIVNNNNYIIDLQLLSDRFPNEHEKLLKYFNNKYKTNLKSLYQPVLFTANYKRKFDKMMKDYKNNIFNYLWILLFFIIVILQAILLNLNVIMTYIYLGSIIIIILLMYIYNNI